MKTTNIFSTTAALLALGLVIGAGTGCQKSEPKAETPAAATTTAKPAIVSAEKNSFTEVTKHLDPGGSLYLYVSTEQWLAGLSQKIAGFRGAIQGLPNLKPADQENLGRVFDVVTHLIKNSGVEDVSGVGVSSIAVDQGFYRSKFMLHHYAGQGTGFLWTMFGRSPHSLDGLDLLPANTAFASFSDVDVPMLWSVVEKEVNDSGIPGAKEGMQKALADFEQKSGLNLDKLMGSLGGECGIVITLDDTREIALPVGAGPAVEIPEPGILLALKVKDDLLFDRVEKLMTDSKLVVAKADKAGLRMRTVAVPLPLPVNLRPTVARSGDYLFVATTDGLIEQALAVKSGAQPGLKATAEFKKLSQDLPMQGNQFSYLSQRLAQTVTNLQMQLMARNAGSNQAPAALLKQLYSLNPQAFSFNVSANTDEGWLMTGNGNQNPTKMLLLPAVAVPAVAAGMLLPALAKAKARAQSVNCANNLKQIGLAARIWAGDNNDVFPASFMVMTNELATPKVMFCPGDSAHTGGTWADVAAGNCSYQLLAPGAKETDDPATVFALCPVHGAVCLLDGSVQILGPNYQSRLKVVNGRTILIR